MTAADGQEERQKPLQRGPKHQNRVRILRDLLASLPSGTMLDLATGHGKFAVAARESGWDVTAMDARTERMPMTAGIRWLQGDVRDFPTDGYDVITVLGLLYHLDLPDQLDLLRRCNESLTIVDTHVSLEPDSVEDGYLGHYYEELDGLAASWGNPTAFWPTEDSLFRMFDACGYTSVLKVLPFPVRRDRTFYVLSKDWEDDRTKRLVERFDERSTFTLEPQRGFIGGAALELDRVRHERDVALDKLDRLASRKSVRAALGVAGLTAPFYRFWRQHRG